MMPASLAVLNTSPFFIALARTSAYASAPIHTRADADATRDVVAFAPTFTIDAVPALFTCVSDACAPPEASFTAPPNASAKIAFASSTSRAVVIAAPRATRTASARRARTAPRAHRASIVVRGRGRRRRRRTRASVRVLGQRFVTFLAIRVIIRLAAAPSTTARARSSAKREHKSRAIAPWVRRARWMRRARCLSARWGRFERA